MEINHRKIIRVYVVKSSRSHRLVLEGNLFHALPALYSVQEWVHGVLI